MIDRPQSLAELRERFDRTHEQAQELIAESRGLRLKSRELLVRIRRERADEE
jgi:hypothetical protein